MQAAPPLLSFLLILLYHSGWTRGLCVMENSTVARCYESDDLKHIETYQLESLTVPIAKEILTPGIFDNLTSLRHLDLSNGNLKKIEPGSFRTLTNLRSLNFGDNRIEYLELASLDGLTHLRSLNLRKNAIRQLPPALARLKNLKHLDIHGNPLECNCGTLKVRDLIALRGVTVSKKVVCTGPGNMKGTALTKPNATIVCIFEQQDREMQNDQADGSGTDLGSGDEFSEEEEDEYMEVNEDVSSEKPKELEIETPFPTASADFTTKSSTIETTITRTNESIESVGEKTTSTTTSSLRRATEDEEIFFDSEEKKEQTSTTEMSQKKDFKDALFYPSPGSGDGDDGSGEGSGASGRAHYDEEETGKEEEESLFPGTGLFEYFFGFTGSTTTSSDPDLEEEQFIDVSSTKVATDEPIVPSKGYPVESDIDKTTTTDATTKITNGVEILKSTGANDMPKSDIKVEVNEQAEVSTAKQSKKGMGSYVVLAILLAVVAALIGFAAYRGDICRKKRKRGGGGGGGGDVENGTELKDMQKSLLPDSGNSTQPKIASNGNPESVPLVESDKPVSDDVRNSKIQEDDVHQTQEAAPRSLNGIADHPDPVKPPRKLIGPSDDQKGEERPRVDVNSLRENFLAGTLYPAQPLDQPLLTTFNGPMTHATEPNGPPLSPGAQRVKITLQEMPDSVPKTPILITRTTAGENLVKTP